MSLKIAVAGKGGTGKTTVAAGLGLALADKGYEVLALDCDPDCNLGVALGFPTAVTSELRPIAALHDLIEERTGARPGQLGAMFKLNPHVADIPDSHCHRHGPFRLLVMGAADRGGGGCDCAQNTLMRRLVGEVVVGRDEAVVMDMEAGLEHLGRATARAVSAMVVLAEPGRRSWETVDRVFELASDLGIPHVFVLGNRFADAGQFRQFCGERPSLGFLPVDAGIARADLLGEGLGPHLSPATRELFAGFLSTIEEATLAV